PRLARQQRLGQEQSSSAVAGRCGCQDALEVSRCASAIDGQAAWGVSAVSRLTGRDKVCHNRGGKDVSPPVTGCKGTDTFSAVTGCFLVSKNGQVCHCRCGKAVSPRSLFRHRETPRYLPGRRQA